MSNVSLKLFWGMSPLEINSKPIKNQSFKIPLGAILANPVVPVTSVNSKQGDVVLDYADVGADPVGAAEIVQQNLNNAVDSLNTELETKANASAVIQSLSTKADLINGVIPASQLPSFVGEVLEGRYINPVLINDLNGQPYSPESGKIYVDVDSNKTYRWSGMLYVTTGGGGVALGETSETAYRGDRGKIAFEHSQSQGNPHGATTSDINEGNKLYFREDRVRQTVLSNVVFTDKSKVTAADNIETAVGKLQGQLDTTWINATSINGFSFRSGVSTNTQQPLKFAIKDGLLWMSGSIYANILNIGSDIFALTNSNYQLEQPSTLYTVTLSYFPAFYVAVPYGYPESQINFKLTKQSSTLRLIPTSNLSTGSGNFLVVFNTVCLGRLVS